MRLPPFSHLRLLLRLRSPSINPIRHYHHHHHRLHHSNSRYLSSSPESTHDGFAALSIYENQPPPKELPDEEYPEWLWSITKPLPSKQELIREAQVLYERGKSYEYVVQNMDKVKLKRLFGMKRKDGIRDSNALREGGMIL